LSNGPTGFREPSEQERALLQQLAARWAYAPQDWVERVRVQEMNDGRMGSLRLSMGADEPARVFGRRAADYEFADTDGVKVIASLILDQSGAPFELDVWKVDFTPTARLHGPTDTPV
jgi:hypothetical protein